MLLLQLSRVWSLASPFPLSFPRLLFFWCRAGEFVKSIAHYSEAIKRNPSDAAVYYCNRAAARTKLMDFNSALDDCNAALKQNPTYVKAFSRKGALEFLMKEYHKVCSRVLVVFFRT
jgi:tetratricopeptide (TPR) repeat protein